MIIIRIISSIIIVAGAGRAEDPAITGRRAGLAGGRSHAAGAARRAYVCSLFLFIKQSVVLLLLLLSLLLVVVVLILSLLVTVECIRYRTLNYL